MKKWIEKNLVESVPMREALINAIVRFFSCSSMHGNRELMWVFKDVGLVEQLGSGMSRILKVYDKNIFEVSKNFIKVIFPFSEVNGDEIEILLILEKESGEIIRVGSDRKGCWKIKR